MDDDAVVAAEVGHDAVLHDAMVDLGLGGGAVHQDAVVGRAGDGAAVNQQVAGLPQGDAGALGVGHVEPEELDVRTVVQAADAAVAPAQGQLLDRHVFFPADQDAGAFRLREIDDRLGAGTVGAEGDPGLRAAVGGDGERLARPGVAAPEQEAVAGGQGRGAGLGQRAPRGRQRAGVGVVAGGGGDMVGRGACADGEPPPRAAEAAPPKRRRDGGEDWLQGAGKMIGETGHGARETDSRDRGASDGNCATIAATGAG